MSTEVRIPKLGKTMAEAVVVEYRVKVGDEVKEGDCLFEIETDKAAVEIESPADGFVRHILAELGRPLAVGEPVLILADKDEPIPQTLVETLKPVYLENSTVENNCDNSCAVSMEAMPEPVSPDQIALGSIVPLSRLQKITAERMLRSKQRKPCFYLTVKADVTELVALRERLNKEPEVSISYNDLLIRAVTVGLKKFPIMAGRLAGDKIQMPQTINIGLAVSVENDVVVPVVKDVLGKSLRQIAQETAVLGEKAVRNKLKPAELEDGSITISNLGPFGVESFIPIVIPGQCSILGIGAIIDTCVPDNAKTATRKLISLTLAVDHRIANGAYAAGFLDFVKKTLEDTSNFT
jgi:pyruvate dehydrogenase E2 component (dihydrolipoamide acetyltransferase)